ncbi:MAG: peptide ABC transporter substrate-binding protein [Planctomycetota bacterium]
MSRNGWRAWWFLPLAFPWTLLLSLNEGPRSRADFVWVNGTDPASLDPALATGAPEGRLLRTLYEGLTQLDPRTLEVVPGVAERWEVSPQGTEIRFFLRSDARWSNGESVTAEDFVRSWQRLLSPDTRARNGDLLWCVAGARTFSRTGGDWDRVGLLAPKPDVLEVRLEHPVAHFLFLTGLHPLFPVHRTTREGAHPEAAPSGSTSPLISNGAFRLSERRLRHSIRMDRNPYYWDQASVALQSLEALSVESDNTALNLFLAGSVDWAVGVPRSVVGTLAASPEFAARYRPTPYFGLEFLRVNVTRPPFDDPEVRRALSLAVNREEIVERVTRAGEQPAWSFVPWPQPALDRLASQHAAAGRAAQPAASPPAPWYPRSYIGAATPTARREVSSRDWPTLGYDPSAARSRLRALGYRVPRATPARMASDTDPVGADPGFTDGRAFPAFELLYNSGSLNERMAEVIQDQWHRELGIDVRLTHQEWGSYLERTRSLAYSVARSSWIGDYLDPASFLEVLATDGPNNRTGWSRLEYDERLRRAAGLVDASQRAKLLQEAEALLLDELPVIPLYYYVTGSLFSDRFDGLTPNLLDLHSPRWFRPVKQESPR